MSWYRNNIVAIHAALVVCAFAWLWGGLRGPALVPVMPWLVALLAEVMLCFPERRGAGESGYQARERVWKNMKRDPLVWVEIVFLALLIIPFVNNGLCPRCDAAAIAQGASEKPLIGFLPYCVNRLHHLSVFLWFLPTLTAATAVKHSLTKAGKRLFCEMVVWNAVALAMLGFVQQVAGAPGPLWWDGSTHGSVYFFSTFGYPNAGGTFFASCFALSVACWRRHDDDVRADQLEGHTPRTMTKHALFWKRHYMVIPSVLLFFATLNTYSRAAIIFVMTMAILFLLHAAMCTLANLKKKAQRVRMGAMLILVLGVLSVLVSIFMPRKVIDEVSSIGGPNAMLDRYTGKNEYHTRVALDLFWEHPLFGCGGWGYAHLSPTKMTEKELKTHQRGFGAGSANVHNDYLQFLVEHGGIGCSCLVMMILILVLPVGHIWKELFKASRFSSHRPPPPRAIFVLPAGAFFTLIGALVILVHAFGDCSLRSPAVLSLFFCELAALDGFLPRIVNESESEEESKS